MKEDFILDKTIVYKTNNGSNKDIVSFMKQLLPLSVLQAKAFAHKFRASTVQNTCHNVYKWLKNNIVYKEDGYIQEPKLPGVLWRDWPKADCKSYALFSYAVLECLGLQPKLKFIGQSSSRAFDHVYTVCNGYVIDPCLPNFNQEANFKISKLMRVQAIAGVTVEKLNYNDRGYQWPIPDPRDYYAGVGKVSLKEMFNKVKEAAKDVATKAKEIGKDVAFAAPRNAFLVLVKLNGLGLATKLDKAQAKSAASDAKMIKIWKKFGGDPKALKDAIGKGKKKKPIGAKKDKISGLDVDGIGVEPVTTTVVASITAAMPIILAVTALFKELGVPDVKLTDPVTGKEILPQETSGILKLASDVFSKVEGMSAGELAKNVLIDTSMKEKTDGVQNPDIEKTETGTPKPTPKPEDKKGLFSDPTTIALLAGGAFLMYNFLNK